jgi:hypothetical protein
MSIDWAELTAPVTRILGGPALYLPASGGQFLIVGVFDEAFKEVVGLSGDGSPIASVTPVLGMQPRDLPAMPLKGDQVKIVPGLMISDAAATIAIILATGQLFKVREVRPDSHGGAILMLNDISP